MRNIVPMSESSVQTISAFSFLLSPFCFNIGKYRANE